MKLRRLLSALIVLVPLVLTACTEAVPENTNARVLVMGDSLMAVNRPSGMSVASALEQQLGEEVIDRAVIGAGIIGPEEGRGIGGQYVSRAWDWVVLNGYGNDLLWGCGCGACGPRMDRLVSEDGMRGAIPELVARLREDGARVIYTGYLRTPGFASPVEACVALGDEMDRRLGLMAASDPGVYFLSLADVVPDGDQSFHGADRVHPSPKGSVAIAARASDLIERAETR